MFNSIAAAFSRKGALLALAVASAAGCSSQKPAIYEHEHFNDSGTFSRSYPVSDTASCEAARRALLSQGYIITSSDPKLVSGHKSFQQNGDTHLEISFNVVCAADSDSGRSSTMFANALQDRYALKKTNNSASLGVGVLGSVSMPIGSTDDSMVKVASETVSATQFYERYFGLVESFLPKAAHGGAHHVAQPKEAPKAVLGVPEAAAAPAQAPGAQAPAPVTPAEPAIIPEPLAPVPAEGAEPLAPPPEQAPIKADTPASVEPPAPATDQ